MKKIKEVFISGILFAACFCFTTAPFADDAKTRGKMISGTIAKVDCDALVITLSNVKDLKSGKITSPDLILKLNDKTKRTNFEECKEIKAGTDAYAIYTESEAGNLATELMLRVKTNPKSLREKAAAGSKRPAEALSPKGGEETPHK